MGKIPAKTNMISSVIISPDSTTVLQEGQDFNITVQCERSRCWLFHQRRRYLLRRPAGSQRPGRCHWPHSRHRPGPGQLLNPSTPPDPTQFAFFKGINDAGNGKGLLSASVAGGLPAGNFRVCTLTSASNHQPVIMPVAQRGAQDDCQRFVVQGAAGGAANEASSDGQK